jgi:hypothetical protein
MAQASDNTVDNGTGAAVRSDINSRLAALYTNHSGNTDTTMVTKYPYQTWADTSSAKALKLRNAANDGWIPLRGIDDGAVLADTTLPFKVAGTTRMSIDSTIATEAGGPSVLFSTTTNPFTATSASDEGLQITQRGRLNIGINSSFLMGLNRLGTAGNFINFAFGGTQLSGAAISTNGTSVSYNTGSDYRLKENIAPLTGAKARVNQLAVYRFNFTRDTAITVDGFIAHEAQAVVPEAVTGQYNEVDSDGNPVYQGIDQAKFVPLLAAGLKEAYAEIAALTARVEALEAA